MAGEARELAVAGERRGGEVEEPGGDDAAAPPDLGDVGEVEGEAVPLGELRRAGVLQDVEALAIACIMPYSMPLWIILTKWPAPLGPAWR